MKSRILVGSLALSLTVGVLAGCSSSDSASGDGPAVDVNSAVASVDANVTKVTFSLPGMM